jgi:hypothetical protein
MNKQHVHINLDKFGYCTECGQRVLTHFKQWPLPDRPKVPKP